MKVLVTGASGFIGRHVVAELAAAGVDTVAVARGGRPDVAPADWRAVDLLQPGAVAALLRETRPSHLVHLAWNATPGRFWRAPDNLDWAAVTLLLLRSFADCGGSGAMFAGTGAEYGWDRHRLCEADPAEPATFYGKIKSATAAAVLAAGEEFGVACGWGRIFWLYGPHEPRGRLVSDVAAALAAGEPVDCSEGRQRRDFLHVADVAGAFVAALRAGWRGPVNIASGEAVAIRDVVATLAGAAGRPDLIRFGARPTPPDEPPELAADVGLLRDRLGFRPRFPLEAGLSDAYAWWASRLAKGGDFGRNGGGIAGAG